MAERKYYIPKSHRPEWDNLRIRFPAKENEWGVVENTLLKLDRGEAVVASTVRKLCRGDLCIAKLVEKEYSNFQDYFFQRHSSPTEEAPNGEEAEELPGRSFGAWLKDLAAADDVSFVRKKRGAIEIGYCTVLDLAPSKSGYRRIILEERQASGLYLKGNDGEAWDREKEALKKKEFEGKSTQVISFVSELSDDPKARITFSTVDYVDAKAFHNVMMSSRASAYRSDALKVKHDGGTEILNILAVAVVIVIGSQEEPLLLLGRRRRRDEGKKEGEGGYYGGTWGVSIGEQVMPVTGSRRRGGRVIEKDTSIVRTAIRGAEEEVLGDHPIDDKRVRVHAFCLEDEINNFIFVAVADVRPLEFSEVSDLWGSDSAFDKGEHDVFVAIPLERDVLVRCLESDDGFPEDVAQEIVETERIATLTGRDFEAHELLPGGDPKGKPKTNTWQPNSKVRLAAALWYAESA